MKKTNIDRVASTSLPFLVYAQMKAYVNFPFFTFLKAVLKMRKIALSISGEYPEDLKKICSLMISIYRTVGKGMEQKAALSLTKALVLPAALAVQMANFRYVEDRRNLSNLIKYQQMTNREGPTRMNRITVLEQNDRNYLFEIRGKCCFFEVFSFFGVPELTTIFCETDNAIFNIYCADQVIFDRKGMGNRIADGAEFCTFRLRSVSE